MGFDSGRGFTSAGSPVGGQGEIGGTLPVGTEGQILYFDGTTSLWTATSNVFIDDTNNRVGIGITSSLLAKLHVKSASGVTMQVDTSTITNNLTILDSGGLVGIGRTPSSYKLDIKSNDNNGIRIVSSADANILTSTLTNFTLFNNEGIQNFNVNNTYGNSTIASSSISLCQGAFGIGLGDTLGGGVFLSNTAARHLVLNTYTGKDVILTNGLTETIRIKPTETISQVPIAITSVSANTSAILQADSTTKGFLPPRMTSTQASAITKVDGLMLYVTDTNATFTSLGFWGVENNVWVKL